MENLSVVVNQWKFSSRFIFSFITFILLNNKKVVQMKVEKIAENVTKISADSNIFFVDVGKKILIDAGNNQDRDEIAKAFEDIIDPDEIEAVVFTHLHYDHVGCLDLFKNAKFYASKKEIENLKKNPFGTVLKTNEIEKLQSVDLIPLEGHFEKLQVIDVPGHTEGCVCLYCPTYKILFSGDTIFNNGYFGRTDLPTSIPEKMKDSLDKLNEYEYDILCPGHDY